MKILASTIDLILLFRALEAPLGKAVDLVQILWARCCLACILDRPAAVPGTGSCSFPDGCKRVGHNCTVLPFPLQAPEPKSHN